MKEFFKPTVQKTLTTVFLFFIIPAIWIIFFLFGIIAPITGNVTHPFVDGISSLEEFLANHIGIYTLFTFLNTHSLSPVLVMVILLFGFVYSLTIQIFFYYLIASLLVFLAIRFKKKN